MRYMLVIVYGAVVCHMWSRIRYICIRMCDRIEGQPNIYITFFLKKYFLYIIFYFHQHIIWYRMRYTMRRMRDA